jgi:GNAT superfamily N-acetyltransferase
VDVIVAGAGDYVDEAAQIWAEATAARDGDDEVAGLELSRPLIAAVLDSSPRSGLLVARDDQGAAVGFAAIEPLGGKDEETADLRYLGVRPSAWGGGVAQALLDAIPGWLRSAGFRRAFLDVYLDNDRAVRLYERHGWVQAGDPAPHPKSGRLERRYELTVA